MTRLARTLSGHRYDCVSARTRWAKRVSGQRGLNVEIHVGPLTTALHPPTTLADARSKSPSDTLRHDWGGRVRSRHRNVDYGMVMGFAPRQALLPGALWCRDIRCPEACSTPGSCTEASLSSERIPLLRRGRGDVHIGFQSQEVHHLVELMGSCGRGIHSLCKECSTLRMQSRHSPRQQV